MAPMRVHRCHGDGCIGAARHFFVFSRMCWPVRPLRVCAAAHERIRPLCKPIKFLSTIATVNLQYALTSQSTGAQKSQLRYDDRHPVADLSALHWHHRDLRLIVCVMFVSLYVFMNITDRACSCGLIRFVV
jgi:hypothetical protein